MHRLRLLGLGVVFGALFYLPQPLQAGCMGQLIPLLVRWPGDHVVFSGRVTRVEQVRFNPDVQLVTFLVERVWKGDVGPTFEVYNVPTNWTPRPPPRFVSQDNRVSVQIAGRLPGQSIMEFEADTSYVLSAGPMSEHERAELGFADSKERFSFAICSNLLKTVEQAERNGEFDSVGPGRTPQ